MVYRDTNYGKVDVAHFLDSIEQCPAPNPAKTVEWQTKSEHEGVAFLEPDSLLAMTAISFCLIDPRNKSQLRPELESST